MVEKEKNGARMVEGEAALAGRLLRKHIMGVSTAVGVEGAAQVCWSDSATIKRGAFVVRTKVGSRAHGRTRCDHFVFVPFWMGAVFNPCVMEVDQILLVKREGMGWPEDECRLAVGTLYDKLTVCDGGGLQTRFNDSAVGPRTVPGALRLTSSARSCGYKWAVHLYQVHCTCPVLIDKDGYVFLTSQTMGFHGRKDLMYPDDE